MCSLKIACRKSYGDESNYGFFLPLLGPLSLLRTFFLSDSLFVDEHLSRCQSMCASSNLHICTAATPKLSLLYSLVILEMHTDTGMYTHNGEKGNHCEGMLIKTTVRRCFITYLLLRRLHDELYWQQHTIRTIYNVHFYSHKLSENNVCLNQLS